MSSSTGKPARILKCLVDESQSTDPAISYCAGFELQKWRCESLADNLIEWIADYALKEDELTVHTGNMYVRLKQAAVRVYTSDNYKKRGEVGEIALHAICRDFWDTVAIAPRVFYLSASNDVIKSFDLVHMRPTHPGFEIWLGESKFYKNADAAIRDAIDSVNTHIDQGFLKREKLLLGPQISKTIPYYDEINELLSSHTALDELFQSAVFPVCILANSNAAATHNAHCSTYTDEVGKELSDLNQKLASSNLRQKIRIILIYLPLVSKDELATNFDRKLKGLLT